MYTLLLVAAIASLQTNPAERATVPDFQGEGDGQLQLLAVPESAALEFYLVRCTRSAPGGGTFEVVRSGKEASPPVVEAGEIYLERDTRVSFRIEPGGSDFVVGDTFSFVTYEDADEVDALFDRWMNQYVKWIVSREERGRFGRLESRAHKLAFMQTFWQRRDPDPETPENEAREEHGRRFAYTVQNFGAGTPGWATDRGKIYIVLGPPNAIERNPMGRTAFERPSEVWTYNNAPNPNLPASIDIAFVDFTMTGRYEIVDASNLDVIVPLRTNLGYSMSELEAIGLIRSGGTIMDPTTGFRTEIRPGDLITRQFEFQRELREVQKIPQLSLPSLAEVTTVSAAFPSLPVDAEASYFRAGPSEAFVPVTVSIPYARLTPRPADEGYRYEVDILIQVKEEGGEETTPIQDRLEVVVEASELQEYRASELLYQASLMLPPGGYQLVATLRDNPSGAVGQSASRLEIPQLGAESLGLSSLMIAGDAIETVPPPSGGPRPPFQFGNLRLVPNVDNVFSPGDPMVAYVQAFGYALSADTESAELRVDFFILREGRLYSKVTPSYHRPGGEREIAIKSEILLRDYPSGDFVLRARITDELTGQQAERDRPFSVRPR